jgi:hypothetical protein
MWQCIRHWWESQKEGDYWEDKDVSRRIILKWILKVIRWVDMDWIDLPQDRHQWRAVMNMAMSLRVP